MCSSGLRLSILLGLCVLVAGVQAAPPAEYVARDVSWYKCSQVNGTTNTSSTGAGADFPHSLTCTIDANTIKAGTVIRACAHVTVTTGASAPNLSFKFRAGATTIYAPWTTFLPQNGLARNTAWCAITVGGAAPGAAAATYTATEGAVTGMQSGEDPNSVVQPVNLATNGPLVWTFVSRWESHTTGINSVVLNSFTVTITN